MAPPIIHQLPEQNRVLVVDDEPAIHSVTKLSLRGLTYAEREVELLSAESGAKAVDIMRENPDVAVILLDVMMETDSAGLDACRAIREELDNHLVRILLRTGQPGQAPEKETIDTYDLDGYLAKADLDATKLYSSLRAALKSWHELVQLQRHERYMEVLHERAMALHSYDPLPLTLSHILEAALEICPASLGAIELQSFEESAAIRNVISCISQPAAMARTAKPRLKRSKPRFLATRRPGRSTRRWTTPMDCWCPSKRTAISAMAGCI